MIEQDTIKLLRECDAGIKMGISSIEDVYNGVVVDGGEAGDYLSYGRGAGKLPTASAVVADIVELAKNNSVSYIRPWETATENPVVDHSEYVRSFFIRVKSSKIDKSDIAKILDVKKFVEIYEGEIGIVTDEIQYNKLTDSIRNIPGEVLSVIEIMK